MPDITVQDLIRQEATKAGVPPALALAIAEQESGFNPTVLGPKLPSGEQAIGTFQVLPSTAKSRGFDPNDPIANIRGGVGYIRELLDQNNGDLDAVLRTYGGVKTDTDYVPGVLKRLPKFQTQQTADQTPPPTVPPPVPKTSKAEPPAAPQSLFARVAERLKNANIPIPGVPGGTVPAEATRQALTEGVKEFGRGLVNDSTRMADMVRQRLLGLQGERPQPYPEAPTTPAGKVGRALAPVAEFGVGGELAGGAAVGGPLLEAATQVAVAHGLTKSQGGSDTGAAVNAALAGTGPLVSRILQVRAPVIRENAEKKLAEVFAKGLETKGPMVNYAIRTGDIANKEVQNAVQIVGKAASDTLDLPIQASWGKWQTTLAKDLAKKGQSLETALAGPLGSQEVPKAEVEAALNQLVESTQHFAEMPSGDFRYVTFDVPLAKELAVLKNQLASYGDHMTVRNLVDLKRTWDGYVYTLSTAGKVGMTADALMSNASKEALLAGANGIRAALDTHAAPIAALDASVRDAFRLQDLVKQLYKVSPALTKNQRAAIDVSLSAGGGLAGEALGGHWFYGTIAGRTAAHVLENAVESPLWQTATPQVKDAIAKAIVAGNMDAVRRLAAPFVKRTVSAVTTPAAPR